MKTATTLLAAGALALAAPLALAKAPAGSTGLCKDGSYTRDANRATACEGHRGLKTWYAKKKTTRSSSPTQAEPGNTTDLRPDKPAQEMGDRKNNTQPTDSSRR